MKLTNEIIRTLVIEEFEKLHSATVSPVIKNQLRESSHSRNRIPLLRSQSLSQLFEDNQMTLSEGMQYHLFNDVKLDDPVYRPGTTEFFSLFAEAKKLYFSGLYEATDNEVEIFESDLGEWGVYEGKRVPLDFPMWSNINEAKYKGREVTLGAQGAKRSGGRAHVYVRDPKSGNIRKISFGSGMPDAMGDSEKHRKRRKSFAARHGCSKNKNKMSASYWACRATKMFGRNVAGWW